MAPLIVHRESSRDRMKMLRKITIASCLMLTSTLVASESLAFSAVHHHQLSGHPHLHHWHSNLPRCTTDAAAFHARVERGGGGDLGCFQKKTEPRKNALQQYSHWVDTKPLLTKSLTAGIVAALADIATQAVVLKMPKVSIQRVVAFLLTGTFFVGPYLHVWYTLLDKICASQQSHKLRTLLKMGLDQSIGVSIFFPMYFTTYEVATALVHGRFPTLMNAVHKCQLDMWSIVLMNWRIWPLANVINFGVVPQQLQVLFNQILSFFWCIYMSTRME